MNRFRRWSARRPFPGGLLLALGGAEILLTMKAPLPVILHIGAQGLAGYLLPTLMVLIGLLILFNPTQRLFYSIVGVLLSLGTWLTSNLGGFLVGLVLGVVGSSLAFGWLPDQESRRVRRARRRAGRATPTADAEDDAEDDAVDGKAAVDEGGAPEGPSLTKAHGTA
ncbi:DUF6114 domain-containing protein [Streptomyces sp. NPDC091281]|uniref:DUF6114 domain-containing protein n=1 Tax=Streptomyces sp. NPDC091281 TaxID=3365985 RepID=UPI0037FACE07